MVRSAIHPVLISARRGPEGEVLRADIHTVVAYSDLISRFSAATTLSTGIDLPREVLSQCITRHDVLKGCEFDDKGFFKSECAVENITKMNQTKSLPMIRNAYSELATRLITLYGAATSPCIAKETFEKAYKAVKNEYPTLQNFVEITRGLPPGILDDEKLAFSKKEELEQMVKQKTVELQKKVEELERTQYGLSVSEKRFGNLISMLPEPIFEANEEGEITFLNLSAHDSFGYTPKDFDKGINVYQLLSTEIARRQSHASMKRLKKKRFVARS